MRSIGLFLAAAVSELAVAQVPNPSRRVHPGIADTVLDPWLLPLHGPGPLFQYRESPTANKWNHGEGFAPNDQDDVDFGGWWHHDDGTGVEISDINLT